MTLEERFADMTEFSIERFPEFASLLDEDGRELGHDNLYHQESLLDHQHMVLQEAHLLADEMKLSKTERGLLVAGAIWHDIGKPLARAPKDRWVCVACLKPHFEHPEEGCRRCGAPTIPRTIMGYHDHARIGADAFWPVAKREGFDRVLAHTLHQLIRWHSHVHDLIEERSELVPRIPKIPLLLSWADSRGRVLGPFDDSGEDDELAFEEAWKK